MAINYKKLMSYNPTVYGEITNNIGQKIEFVEHPTQGDEAQVICVCHELELAAYSGFYDIDDMEDLTGDYVPSFEDGRLLIGDFEAE